MTNKCENYVFCIDSDGCAMDTMTYKHKLFFGPLAAEVFHIEDRENFLKNWNHLNLYSKNRGINRFVGLFRALEAYDYPEITILKAWIETTTSLSNESLENEIKKKSADILLNTLRWSELVNENIRNYKGDVASFSGVQKAIKILSQLGKVYVVSSANKGAVDHEWEKEGLVPYISEFYCQDKGKKEDVLALLKQFDNSSKLIMMIGDSPGDLEAARKNDVLFYPILADKEVESWSNLISKELQFFLDGTYGEERQENLINQFWENLS
ncbi:MAG: HAD hydrolase-like protein [Streptococcus sp.]|nr:HAD hydrolase-like protein [Streptococcus sp.]